MWQEDSGMVAFDPGADTAGIGHGLPSVHILNGINGSSILDLLSILTKAGNMVTYTKLEFLDPCSAREQMVAFSYIPE